MAYLHRDPVNLPLGAAHAKTSGLGLSICKLLVERHGGSIALRNHPAGGCEVTVALPLERQVPAYEALPSR